MAAGFKTAQVNASDVPATQTNFPSYVDLSRLGITTLAEAQSVRVYADSGKTTEWAREIVSATEMHVKVPSLTSTVSMYVDWDGVRSDYAATDTYGRNAVWSDYRLVMHGNSLSTDSTGNNSITTSGASVSTTTKKLGGASFSIIGNSATAQITPGSVSGRTVSTIVRSNSSFSGNDYILDARTGEAGGYALFASTGNIEFGWASAYVNGASFTSGTAISRDTFYHIVFKAAAGWTDDIKFGNRYANLASESLDGYLDEIRITKTADLSASWALTEYNNQSDEPGFWGTWSDVGGGASAFIPKVSFIG